MILETSKNLGGVGALLIFVSPLLGALPGIGGLTGILSLIGAVLILVALKGFADYYKENGIFNNALYAIIPVIVGAVVFVATLILAAVGFFTELGLDIADVQSWSSLSQINWQAVDLNLILRFIGVVLLAVVILFVFLVITVIFLRRSLGMMATKTGVGLFATTGTLLLVGAVLTIIIIGILLVWVAILLLAIAFFSIRTQQPQPPTATPAQTPPQV
jgi:uncharacterized membrane protein